MAPTSTPPDSQQQPSLSSSRTSSPNPHSRSPTPSTISDDSQVVLLDHPSPQSSCPQESNQSTSQISSPTNPSSSPTEPRRCWICLATETEDTPTSSAWRTPCPCALTAHESCLLDWVAQIDQGLRRQGKRKKIECPQCKAEITVARPRSYLVDAVLAVESVGGRLVVPIALVTAAGGVLGGLWFHGLSTVFLVFGTKDAQYILGLDRGSIISLSVSLVLPLIPVVLVLSRASIADNILPILPMSLLWFQSSAGSTSNLWPPSAAFTFAILPYIRTTYNAIYFHFLEPRRKAWLKELEPRGGEQEEGVAEENNPAPGEHGEGMHLEIGLDIQIIAEEDAPNEPPVAAQPPAHPDAGDPPPAPAPPREHRHHDIGVMPPGLISAIVGALLFPTLSAAMGELLKLALPYTWRTPPRMWERRSEGLLQTRWGRSVVGGCLLVFLKDTAVLYSRYRLVQIQRERSVLDWRGGGRRAG